MNVFPDDEIDHNLCDAQSVPKVNLNIANLVEIVTDVQDFVLPKLRCQGWSICDVAVFSVTLKSIPVVATITSGKFRIEQITQEVQCPCQNDDVAAIARADADHGCINRRPS